MADWHMLGLRVQHVATREVAAILGIHSQRDKVRANFKTRQSMIVQAPEEGADVVTAAKRVLMSSELESLGLRDKRDISMLVSQSALQVWQPLAVPGTSHIAPDHPLQIPCSQSLMVCSVCVLNAPCQRAQPVLTPGHLHSI